LAAIAEQRGAWREARDQLRDLLAKMEGGHPMASAVRARLKVVEGKLP